MRLWISQLRPSSSTFVTNCADGVDPLLDGPLRGEPIGCQIDRTQVTQGKFARVV